MIITTVVFIGLAVSTGIVGAGMNIKGIRENLKANEINNIANKKIRRISSELNYNRLKSAESLEKLAKEKIRVLNEDINYFIREFEKIKNVDLNNSIGLDELKNMEISKNQLQELKSMREYAVEVSKEMVKGGTGGALIAFGAYGMATKLAVASTGTAISNLSGIAATNATLAFFGGGSLTTGGLGIAGGTVVLGGLVAGPALLIMGIILGNKSNKSLEEALTNEEKVKVAYEEIDISSLRCVTIYRRANMFNSVIKKISSIFINEIDNMKKIIEKVGTNYELYTENDKMIIKRNVMLAGTIKSLLDVSILNEEGKLTEESEQALQSINSIF